MNALALSPAENNFCCYLWQIEPGVTLLCKFRISRECDTLALRNIRVESDLISDAVWQIHDDTGLGLRVDIVKKSASQ